jgi:predicted O-linked N-acetylglucosamine transferase (SPINDLY family)
MDRKRFELYAYSLAPDDRSAARDRIRRNAHAFRDFSALSSADCAQQIRRDEIDILIDAAGHAEGGRFEIIAARAAPLQVLYLGYVCTLGSSRVDYAILDPVVAPIETAGDWSEHLAHLPDSYFLYDFRSRPKTLALKRDDYGLPTDQPVLCAFHKGEKIDPETFSLWMRILAARERAVLWLLADSERAAANLRRAAQQSGVDPARLVFCGREDHERYLARLRLADFFLDALQHNAIVTACDCLNVGLPVLTRQGTTLTSRAAESLLKAANLPELVAPDSARYQSKALELLDGGAERVKRKLELERGRAPLFDTASQVRAIEAALAEMWRKHAGAAKPSSFSVRRNDG